MPLHFSYAHPHKCLKFVVYLTRPLSRFRLALKCYFLQGCFSSPLISAPFQVCNSLSYALLVTVSSRVHCPLKYALLSRPSFEFFLLPVSPPPPALGLMMMDDN